MEAAVIPSKETAAQAGASRFGTLTRVMMLAGAYVLGGWLGRQSGVLDNRLPLVWPPAGIALGAVLLFGYRYLPGVALGAFVVSSMVSSSVSFAIGTAVGSCVGAAVCAYLLEKMAGFRPSMERVRDVAGLACAGAVMGTTVNAAFTVLSLAFEKQIPWDAFSETWTLWWVPDCMAILVVCPFILSWGSKPVYEWDFSRKLESIVCGTCLVASIQVSFNSWAVQGAQSYPLAYLPYPFLIWLSLRFGQRGATSGTLLVSGLAIHAFLHGGGPFVTPDTPRIGLTLLGTYIGVLALSNMFLAAAATERDVAEAAVRESEKRYRGVVEDQPELIWRFDTRGNITFVNQAYCRHYGKSRDELLGSSFMPMIPDIDRDILMTQFEGLGDGDRPLRYDFRTTSPDGKLLWVQCAVRAITGENKQVIEYQAVGLDVTSRKMAEDALQQSEERLASILEHMADGLLIFDEQGRVEAINPATERILGFTSSELAGQNIRNLLHLDSTSEFDALTTGIFQPRESKMVELKAYRRNGSVFPMELDLSKGSLGAKPRFIGVMRDISERKEFEEQSRHQQKMEAVGRLAGGIAHDFNNLMQAIIGYSNLLRRQVGPEADPEPAEQITRAVERASRLTSKLLAFSRRQVVQPRYLNLTSVVGEIAPLIEKTLGSGVRLELQLDANAGSIRADISEIEQVILNLVQNAKDAMPRGGVLTLTTLAVSPNSDTPQPPVELPEGEYTMFAVRDTGFGMSAEVRAHLFEPFFTTKPKGGASGLGLSIVYGIVKQFGGGIDVSSREGEGTTFRIFLPKVQVPTAEPAVEVPVAVPRRIEQILLVEDEEIVREFIREVLEAEGYIVAAAADGQVALDLFLGRFSNIDLVITDLMMPNVSGRELAARIQQVRPEVPIVYMSGHTNDEVIRREILSARAIFLQKPFRPETLLAKVREASLTKT